MVASILALLFVPSPSGVAKAITTLPCLSHRIQPAPSLPGYVSELPFVFTLNQWSSGLRQCHAQTFLSFVLNMSTCSASYFEEM